MFPNLKLAAVLALLAALTAAAPASAGARRQTEDGGFSSVQVINGTAANAGEFPYIVSITEDSKQYCGGVLISARTILTAAHCSENENLTAYSVRAGSLDWASGGTVVGVSKIVTHPDWNITLADSDIALWYLDAPIEASSTIGYAVLPFQGSDPEGDTLATVAGWGRTAEGSSAAEKLLQVSVPIVDRATCAAAQLKNPDLFKVIESMICTGLPEGGKGACGGDSGGPLIDAASGVLLGLTSWSFGCARPEFPTVYAHVGLFVDWINKNRL